MKPSQLPSIREFMSRDHRQDVDRLNELLHSSGDAGLAREVPPIPFTGDIDSMEKGNCICLIGINPLWSAKHEKHVQEYIPAEKMISRFRGGEERAYSEYIESRLRYFEYEYANWGHFDKPASGYPELCFPNENKRSVWGKHAFAMDILPYFSRNANRISGSKVAILAKTDPALNNHQRVIKDIISATRPNIIHLNGSHGMHAFNKLLKPMFELQDEFNKYKLNFGHVEIGDVQTKIFAHNQYGRWPSNPRVDDWPKFIGAWRKWLAE